MVKVQSILEGFFLFSTFVFQIHGQEQQQLEQQQQQQEEQQEQQPKQMDQG